MWNVFSPGRQLESLDASSWSVVDSTPRTRDTSLEKKTFVCSAKRLLFSLKDWERRRVRHTQYEVRGRYVSKKKRSPPGQAQHHRHRDVRMDIFCVHIRAGQEWYLCCRARSTRANHGYTSQSGALRPADTGQRRIRRFRESRKQEFC